ncbi:MAG: acetyl-CoA carboxylase biotin carboxyl carrier protein subunit [Candidatus Paceibacterota bacterium]|jgi:biotin carboxyl carrier protein
MNFKIKIKDKEYSIEIKELQEKTEITINGQKYFFDSNNSTNQEKFEENEKNIFENKKLKEIKTPLAGSISEIFVKQGEEIKPGQKLMTLSAMKMENDILSEARGTIKKILVIKDQKVREGEILIILE